MRGDLSDEAGNLLRFLRDLARSRRVRVLDVAGHDEVHWLAELPAELPVHTDARPGEPLFGLPPIPITPPAALGEFDGWLALRRWYRTLRAHAEIPDGRELVLATGLLTWTAADGTAVRDHLLLTPVRIEVDPGTERVDVVLSDRPTALRDRELLDGLPGFHAARTDWVRDAVRSGQGAALRDSTADILRKWCGFAFDEPIPFREDWTDTAADPSPRVRLAPALVLRAHADLALIDYLDAMLSTLVPTPTAPTEDPTGPPTSTTTPPGEDPPAYAGQGHAPPSADLSTRTGRSRTAPGGAPDEHARPSHTAPGGDSSGHAGQGHTAPGGDVSAQADQRATAPGATGGPSDPNRTAPIGYAGGQVTPGGEPSGHTAQTHVAPGGDPTGHAGGRVVAGGDVSGFAGEGRAAVGGGSGEGSGGGRVVAGGKPSGAAVRGGRVPGGVARFLRPGVDERLAHVPDRQAAGGLFTALLARGQRVLAVSGRPRELRDALPPELAGLAVTVTGGRADLEPRLRELTQRVAAHDPERYERALAEHAARSAALDRETVRLREMLAELRADVSYDFGPGYRGSLEDLEELLLPGYSWMPVIPGLPERPPLTAAEAAELVELLAGQTPQRRARTAQTLPEPSALPGTDQVRALISVAQVPAPDPAGDLAQRLADRDPAAIDRLEAAAGVVHRALTELGVSWDSADWTLRALRDGMAGPAPGWERLVELGARAAAADRALRSVGARWVLLPTGSEGEMITAARELRAHLAGGGTLKRGPLRPAVQRRAEPLLAEATVDGEPPATVELLDVVIAALEGRQAVEELVAAWSAAGVELTETPALDGMVAQFAGLYTRLAQVRTALRAIGETAGLLRHVGLGVRLTSPEEWIAYRGALETVRIRRRASTAWAALASLRQAVELQIRRGGAPPELTAAAAALSARDLPAYERCLAALETAREEQRAQARCDALLTRLREAHPVLAAAPSLVPGEWQEAWRWAYVSSYLLDRPRTAAERSAESDLDRTEALAAEAKSALAAAEAWGWTLGRAGARPAPEALPLWIMPAEQVPTTVPPVPDAFDVVVVDHDGEGAEALFLLWLAPRVIILGPGGPIPADGALTPASTFFGALAARFTVLDSGGTARAPGAAPQVPAPRPPGELVPGRSIVSYQRTELLELVAGLAAETRLTGDLLVAHARGLLACPDDEQDIVEARLRYAVRSLDG